MFRTWPDGYQALHHLSETVKVSGLEPALLELVKMRASQINGCAYCIDMHSKDARARGETEQRLYALNAWRETSFYSDRERAVLASGVIITGSTPVFDLVREKIYRRSADSPLEIPAGAVVVPGSRAVQSQRGREWGLSLYAPVIVKYRDEKTDASTQLEEALR